MYLAEVKAKKLEPIKQCLEKHTNYQIEPINDGFVNAAVKPLPLGMGSVNVFNWKSYEEANSP